MCAVCTGERSELQGDLGVVSPLHVRAVDLPYARRCGMLHRNPWTEAAIESLRTNPHLQLPLQGPVRVLGELRGLGKSWFIALAYPLSDRHRGFLFVSDEEPYPLEVVVLDADGQTIERFRFPPH